MLDQQSPAVDDSGTPDAALPESSPEGVSRRQALKTYVPPAITVIGLANVTSLRSSGPVSRRGTGNNGFGQERQGAPKDGPPAGKPENDKPGSR